jgi:hypothetical protein
MKPDRWSNDLDGITRSFQEAFGALTIDELNWKPNAATWSIAQNIHHLIVVNESYYPILEQIRNNTYYSPRFGQIGFINRFFGKLILSSVQPEQTRKTKTFPIWEPELSAIRHDILAQFAKHQDELKSVIRNNEDLLAKNTVISSPANRVIVYKLETAYDIMVAHEKRHFRQAQELNDLRATKIK